MMNNQKLHEEVKKLARIYLESEKNLIGPLIQVKQLKAYRDFECHGLDEYCEKQLGFSESVARMFQTVINHAVRKPGLREALEANRISVAYASKIVSQLTPENIDEVLAFTEEHSFSETEKWLAEKRGGLRFWNIALDDETWGWLRKVMDIKPDLSKGNETIKRCLKAEYHRISPVEKANRAEAAKAKRAVEKDDNDRAEHSANLKKPAVDVPSSHPIAEKPQDQPKSFKRIPLTAAQKNAVHKRDGWRCTQRNGKDQRCKETKYLHIHHIQFVSEGGGNEPENLTTLCAEHHDLAHPMSCGFESDAKSEWSDRYGWMPGAAESAYARI